MRTIDTESVLVERACEALALAYDPNEPLASDYYIPSVFDVEEAYGYALRQIFGEKPADCSMSDRARLRTVRHLDQLDKRIREGVWKAILGDPEFQRFIQHHFSPTMGKLEFRFFMGKGGDLQRFQDGAREKALTEFEAFWTEAEKTTWRKIHFYMRQYTKREFERKS